MPKGTILLIDSDRETRDTLLRCLTKKGYDVHTLTIPDELPHQLATNPDLIIFDLDMPDFEGMELCQSIRHDLFAPILLIGSSSEENDAVLALGVGADYYFSRPLRASELIACAEAAIRRERIYSQRRHNSCVIRIKDLILDIPAHELRRNSHVVELSATEFKLVEALARNAGRTLTRDHLLDKVWEMKSDGVYTRTVDVHIARIRRKLGDDPVRQTYIKTVPGMGYRMVCC